MLMCELNGWIVQQALTMKMQKALPFILFFSHPFIELLYNLFQ